ncbi:hypothetical protein [Anaerorhabdus sp.]|uniref:hypothetical protein n=1 Tax=Anaerorhabdus sp. TaxID=1872524 RepID=UPI002FC5B745
MKKKELYPIGYLLKKLNISYTKLANYLHVDRTVVNKWALGNRNFDRTSVHYDSVVNFLLLINKKNNNKILENFFNKIYPTSSFSANYLKECIDKFINTTDLISLNSGTVIEGTPNTYNFSASVYRGEFGRFNSLINLLNKLSALNNANLFLYDSDDFLWLLNNNYSSIVKEHFIDILNNNKITLILNSDYLKKNPILSRFICSFYFSNNFQVYYFKNISTYIKLSSYYLIENECLVIGSTLANEDLYSILLEDPYSLDSYSVKNADFLQNSSKKHIVKNYNDVSNLIYIISETLIVNIDESYYYSNGITFLSMSENLLETILEENNISTERKKSIIELYRRRRHHFFTNGPFFRQICYLKDIDKMLSADYFYYEELSLLSNKKILLNNNKVKHHIKDTIELLKCATSFNIGFLREFDSYSNLDYTIICRKNQYLIVYSNYIQITRETDIINESINIINNEWENQIPFQYKNNTSVSIILSNLISD